jgi:hypothetical protein
MPFSVWEELHRPAEHGAKPVDKLLGAGEKNSHAVGTIGAHSLWKKSLGLAKSH